ncbi:plant virulence effector HPE1-like domain-containing protein [Rhizobium tumorigenes]|uniref:Plant virulence effector HPE1-like domain-containing protein n=1 Tax=Rhizobium tumorigenes TaxID=2041385 RepID=A0AAF1K8I1_9HYPH|nr:plant virulence effector HPE1-like domain-containing protein [Rhizobium tumorigenes]WFR95974.1 plant virulence effector HPE1-like domain-containing protein [Rhizobium tumorigenes]
MRPTILIAAFVLIGSSAMLIGSSAMASSFLTLDGTTRTSGDSIQAKVCVDCAPIKQEVAKKSYVVPELPVGTQTTVVRQINGEQKVVRTEAWLGGSPVVFISKASPEALAAAGVSPDGIDRSAMTAAIAAATPLAKPLDTSDFQLRLQ